MSWTAILTMLGLAITSASLVKILDWQPMVAFQFVIGVVVLFAIGLFVMVYLLCSPADRTEFWRYFVQGVQSDLSSIKQKLIRR